MTDSQLLVLELGSKGYSCAQMLLVGALRYLGRENPDLIRAMGGLAQGGGCGGELCGALSGGLCLLGLYLSKGRDGEQPDGQEQVIMNYLVEWFRDTHGVKGNITCDAILGAGSGAPACRGMNAGICGALVASTLDKAVGLLVENGFDVTAGREI